MQSPDVSACVGAAANTNSVKIKELYIFALSVTRFLNVGCLPVYDGPEYALIIRHYYALLIGNRYGFSYKL